MKNSNSKIIKLLTTLPLFLYSLQAQEVSLNKEQSNNWQIKTQKPIGVSQLPLGEFIVEVSTPPSLLATISLPFEANVKKLSVANYQEVKKGQLLAEVTGTEWIATQQKAISDAIELRHHTHLAERKEMLCKENIIPKKECAAANAELKADKIKIVASKALLQSYGASEQTIDSLLNDFKLSSTIALKSPVDGRIITLNASPGKSTSPSDALFIIKKEGALWLESDIEATRTAILKEGQQVNITLANQNFDTTILQLSPTVNPLNQTRHVRFLVPDNIELLSGLRSSANIKQSVKSLKIAKTSIINHESNSIVFVKTTNGFNSVVVNILGEEAGYYFVAKTPQLQGEIATSSVAILKNLLGGEDE